jgi:hypothetical protein
LGGLRQRHRPSDERARLKGLDFMDPTSATLGRRLTRNVNRLEDLQVGLGFLV